MNVAIIRDANHVAVRITEFGVHRKLLLGFVPRTLNDEWYQESLRQEHIMPEPALPDEDYDED